MRGRNVIIWEAEGANPGVDRTSMGDRTVLVAVSNRSDAVPLAKEFAEDGAKRIELRGGFGPVWPGTPKDGRPRRRAGRDPLFRMNYDRAKARAKRRNDTPHPPIR